MAEVTSRSGACQHGGEEKSLVDLQAALVPLEGVFLAGDLLQPRRTLVVVQASGNKSVSRIGLRCAHPCSFCLGARSIRRGAPRQEVCLGQRRIFQLYAGQGENLMQPSLRSGASRTNRIV